MKKQYKVSIPKPCHEDWSAMTPKEKGRFCGSCSKTVVDFTKKSKEEIQEYLSENFGKRVCGHFNKRQLDTITIEIPSSTFEQQLSFQKLFILALLFVMGTTLFSCQYSNGKKQKIEDVIVIESLEKDIESQLQEIDSLQTDAFIKKLSKTSNNDGYFIVGAVPMISLNGTTINKSPLPLMFNKNFHLDSIIEIEENEIITEDVPLITGNIKESIEISGDVDYSNIEGFNINSIIEIEEEEIIIEDVPTLMGETLEEPIEIEGDIEFTEVEPPEIEEDFVLGLIIEEHPKFPDAKDISREKAREDFNQKINQFFQKHLKAPQVSLDLKSGSYKILSEFIIDKNGEVIDVKVKAPHKAFEKEAKRVLEKLPVFIPGEQRGKVVRTKYTLPIRIEVE